MIGGACTSTSTGGPCIFQIHCALTPSDSLMQPWGQLVLSLDMNTSLFLASHPYFVSMEFGVMEEKLCTSLL